MDEKVQQEIKNKIIEFGKKFDNLSIPYANNARRLMDVNEDGTEPPVRFVEERNSGVCAICDALFEPKGAVEVTYDENNDKYLFRIDDMKIASLIGKKQLEPCLNYKNDKEDVLFYEEFSEENIEKYIKEYLNLIYEEKTDNIVAVEERTNMDLKSITLDLVHFAKTLQAEKSYLQFRLLEYTYFDERNQRYEVLVKMILWPDNPCPISSFDDSKEENNERKRLIKSIYEFFYNVFVDKILDKESALAKIIKRYSNGETLLNIQFRREEDKTVDRMAAKVADESPYVIYDTNRFDFVKESPEDRWVRIIKLELYDLGKILESYFKNLISFKISFKKVDLLDGGQSYAAIINYDIFDFRKLLDSKTENEISEDTKENMNFAIESKIGFVISEAMTTDKKLNIMKNSYKGFLKEEDIKDKKEVFDFQFIRKEKVFGEYAEDMLDLYTIYEYRCDF